MAQCRSFIASIVCTILALGLGASSAYAAQYTFAGKLTFGRGGVHIPMVGNTSCGQLTIVSQIMSPGAASTYPVVRGANTDPTAPVTMNFDWMTAGVDRGCVKHAPNVIITTTGMGVGGQFTIPPNAFSQPYPPDLYPSQYVAGTDLPVKDNRSQPPAVQLATSFGLTGPMSVRSLYAGTMSNGTNSAAFRRFRTGAWSTQTGRDEPGGGPAFTWCPPPATQPSLPGGFCTDISQAGFPGTVKYNGTANSFGGTMSLVLGGTAGVGSLAIGIGANAVAFNALPDGISLASGRGFAQYNMGVIATGEIWGNHMLGMVNVGPRLGSQTVITMVTALQPTPWPPGNAYTWGFPWTTRTVVVRNTGGPAAGTQTARGWDCPGGFQGPNCTVATGNGTGTGGTVARNISLVAGGVGIAVLPAPFGANPTRQLHSMQLLLPEPGATLQLLAGLFSVLGIAAWRWRRVR